MSSFVNFSLRILNSSDESMSSQKTLAIVKCPEKYETLAKSCAPLFSEAKACADQLNIFLTGDIKKFQNTVLGLNIGFSTANHACTHFKIHRNNKTCLDLDWDFYHRPDMFRDHDDSKVGEFGVLSELLIKVKHCCVIQCALHMLMQISDILRVT